MESTNNFHPKTLFFSSIIYTSKIVIEGKNKIVAMRIPMLSIHPIKALRMTRHFSSKSASRASKNRSLSSARPLPQEEVESDWGPIHDYKQRAMIPYHPGRLAPSIQQRTSAPQEMTLSYAGTVPIPITSNLQLIRPEDDTPRGIWPVYRIMVSTHRLENELRIFRKRMLFPLCF
jgi:hypothetical protein